MKIVVIDPFISGNHLVKNIIKNNIECIALLTNPSIANEMRYKGRFDANDYSECIYLNEFTNDQLLVYLIDKDILTIISGTEYTLDLADQLNAQLRLKLANPVATTQLRINKSSILKTLLANNIAVPKMHIIDLNNVNLAQQIDNTKNIIPFPIFVKPCSSGGSFAIKRCKNNNDFETFITQSHDRRYNLSPNPIKKIIAQQFIDAPEYAANVVSYAGKHYISGIWAYKKNYRDNDIPIYEQGTIANLPIDTIASIQAFIQSSLNAIDYRYGFSHIELFLLDNKPIMVEINLRLPGGFGLLCEIESLVYGSNQVQKFFDLIDGKPINNNLHTNHAAAMLCINNKETCTVPEFLIEDFQTIESFVQLKQNIPSGTIIGSAKKLSDTLLYIALHHHSSEKLEHDIKSIYRLLTEKYRLCL